MMMNDQGTMRFAPLAKHNQRYSVEGLFLRYARGQVRICPARVAFFFAVSCLLAYLISPQIGIVALAIVCFGEILDCLFLRLAPGFLASGVSIHRLKWISTATGFVHGAAITVSSAAPQWMLFNQDLEAGRLHSEPIFTIGLLVGAAINAGITLPYNRSAAIARLLCYASFPVLLLVAEPFDPSVSEFQLHASGLFVLCCGLIWFLYFVRQSFERTRQDHLTQALQQQELEEAYQRLLYQQQEAKKLALVAEHANDSIMLVDRNGHVLWVNAAFTRITGFSFEEILGRQAGELLNHPDTDPAALAAIVEGRRKAAPFRVEILNRCKDGSEVWLETNQVPVFDTPTGTVTYLAVERDITATKEHEQQLERARAAAEEGARAKAEFLATMSHEIRTPMNGVIGMVQLLEETNLSPDQKLYTDTIQSSASSLLALINDILDLSRLEEGQVTLSPVEFDIRKCAEETARLLRTQAEAKGLELILDMDADIPQRVVGDDRRLRQILTNLAGNAIKFTEKGRVQISLEINKRNGSEIELEFSISDTGIGIEHDMLTRIFERFSQADAAISRRFGGTGLGLSISRRLAEAMGGRISVTSQIDIGSCFTLRIPFEVAVEQSVPVVARSNTEMDMSSLAGARVLIAEDNKLNRLLVRKFLKDVPVELLVAENGSEAVALVEAERPDIVLMDISMPIMDGLEATRTIRKTGTFQPFIVALTANAFDSDREACLTAGMDEFLTKPIDKKRLLNTLMRFAEQAPRSRAS